MVLSCFPSTAVILETTVQGTYYIAVAIDLGYWLLFPASLRGVIMIEGLHDSSASFTPHGGRSVHDMQGRWRGCSRVLFSLIFSSVIYMSQLCHVFNHLFLLVYWPPLHAEHLPPSSYHQQFHLVCRVPSCDVERFSVISSKITCIYSYSCITSQRHQQSFLPP
jgi:hypothetical protein